MFTALWSLLSGAKLSELLILGLASTLLLAGAAGFGYYEATGQCEKTMAAAPIAAAKAQEQHDIQHHADAKATSDAVEAHHATNAPQKTRIVKEIVRITVPNKSCDLTADQARLLNEAAHTAH